ncbi:MAG: HAMP domain-containing histidine kinase [Eubacterium sp.]|nr:HAMP domain-containing histidine kinase [Eubacterium sp.]
MNEFKNLRVFLIKKFLITIALVSVAEYAILSILNKTLIPFVVHMLFKDQDLEIIGIAGMIIIILLIIGRLIVQLLKFLTPDALELTFEKMTEVIDSTMGGSGDKGALPISNLTTSQEIFFVMFLFTIFVIILIPYIIGALYFAKAVIREVRRLEEADKKKQKEFEKGRNLMLSDIAHDLRTPITTVAGYAKALEDGMVAEDKKEEYLSAIQRKSSRMNDLITLLFDYVRLDSEGFKLTKEKVDICELCRETAAFMYQDIEDAEMTLEVDIPEKRVEINADKIQISRVITNLLTNAIRHNKPGTSIGFFLTIDDDETIRIMVADNGDKIDEDYAKTIFEPFVVGDESRSTKGGTGLGLSIAKKILEMHGYRIRLVQHPNIKKFAIAAEYEKMFLITI